MLMKYLRIAAVLVMTFVLMTVPSLTVYVEGKTAETVEAVEVVEINTLAELKNIADNPTGTYRLAADLDMMGADWQPMAFSGRLDGAGHTLYNLSVSGTGGEIRETRDGNLKQYDTAFAGLFSTLENAEIVNLNIVGAGIFIENQSHCFAAVLAGYVNRSVVRGCTVSGRVHMVSHGVNVGIGGLAGYGCGDFENCAVEVELVFEDQCLDGRCEQFMGGLLACGIGNIEKCGVKIDGWDSCNGYVHNGGLVGMYYDCNLKVRGGAVKDNLVSGQITFYENNPDRRAYCTPYLGEALTGPAELTGNTCEFERNELMDYSEILRPEQCQNPRYVNTVTPPSCDKWGHTEHQCQDCGYRWTDSYTPPAHTEGDWEIVREATTAAEGLRQRHCTVCGELLAEEVIPIVTEEAKGGIGYWWLLPVMLVLVTAGVLFLRKKMKRY